MNNQNTNRNREADANNVMKLRHELIQNLKKAKKLSALQEVYDRTKESVKDALMAFPHDNPRCNFIINSHRCGYTRKDIELILKELDSIKEQLDEARCAYANLIDIRKQYVSLVNEVVDVNTTINDMKLSHVEELEKPYDNCTNCKCDDPTTCRKCASMVDPESDTDMEDVGEEYDDEDDDYDEDDEKESDINSDDEVITLTPHELAEKVASAVAASAMLQQYEDNRVIGRYGHMDVQCPVSQMPPVQAPVSMPVPVPPQMPQVNVPDDIDLNVGDVEIDPSIATGDITEVRDITINVSGDVIVDSYNGRNSRNN